MTSIIHSHAFSDFNVNLLFDFDVSNDEGLEKVGTLLAQRVTAFQVINPIAGPYHYPRGCRFEQNSDNNSD